MEEFKDEEYMPKRINEIEIASKADDKEDIETVLRNLKTTSHEGEIFHFLNLITHAQIEINQNLLALLETEETIPYIMELVKNKNIEISEASLIALEHILSFGLDTGIIFTECGGFNMIREFIESDDQMRHVHGLIIISIISQYGASFCNKSMRILPLNRIQHYVQNDTDLLFHCANVLLSFIDNSNIIDDINESLRIISTIILKDDKESTTIIFSKLLASTKKGLFNDINPSVRSFFENNIIEVISKSTFAKVITTGINLFGMMLRKNAVSPKSVDRIMRTIFYHCHSKSKDIKNSACWLLAEIARIQNTENTFNHLIAFLQNDYEATYEVASFNQKQDILYYLKHTLYSLPESQLAEIVANQENIIDIVISFHEIDDAKETLSTILTAHKMLSIIHEIRKEIDVYEILSSSGFIDFVEECSLEPNEMIESASKELLKFFSIIMIKDS